MAQDPPIKFRCPSCRRVCRVPADYAGQSGRCPGCKQALLVPGGSSADIDDDEEAFELISDDDASASGAAAAPAKSARASKPARSARASKPARSAREPAAEAAAEAETGPQLPPLLKVYGIGLPAIHGLAFFWLAYRAVIGLQSGASVTFLAIHGAGLVAALVFVRLGLGLLQREWSAVTGLCVMGGLAAIFSLGLMPNAFQVGLITLISVILLYGVPVRLAFLHMDRFEGVPEPEEPPAPPASGEGEAE